MTNSEAGIAHRLYLSVTTYTILVHLLQYNHYYQHILFFISFFRLLQNIQTIKESNDANRDVVTAKPGVTFSEDQNMTVNITPRNIGRKVKPTKKTENFHGTLYGESYNKASYGPVGTDKNHIKNREKSESPIGWKNSTNQSQIRSSNVDPHILHDHRKTAGTPITVVTVSYGDEENGGNVSENKITKKRRKRQEVTTLIQDITLSDSEDDIPTCDSIVQAGNHDDKSILDNQKSMKSEPEKNYYEISRQNPTPAPVMEPTSEHVVVKSTKTIEFCEDCPKETVIKSVINSVAVKKLGSSGLCSSKNPPRSASKKVSKNYAITSTIITSLS